MSNKRSAFILITSGLINVIVGIGVGFLLPKFLTYEDYSYYRIFMFYIPFYNLLHIGFADGVYRLYGSFDIDQLKSEKTLHQSFSFFLMFQIILFVITFLIVWMLQTEVVYLYIVIAFLILNINTVFRKLFSSIKEFRIVAVFNILQKVSVFAAAVLLFAFSFSSFHLVVLLFLGANIVMLGIEFYYFRHHLSISIPISKDYLHAFMTIVKSGFVIMLAYFLSYAILGLDRFFIEYNYSLIDYAIYSFAYAIVSVFLVTLNSLNSFIYPLISRVDKEDVMHQYKNMSFYINTFFTVIFFALPIIIWIINIFLPNYQSSIPFFIILSPVILFQTHYSLKYWQFYNIRENTKYFLVYSLISLVIGLVLNIGVLVMNLDLIYYAYATIISLIVWVTLLELDFNKHFKIIEYNTYLFYVLIIIVVVILSIQTTMIAYIIAPILILISYGIMYNKRVLELLQSVVSSIGGKQ